MSMSSIADPAQGLQGNSEGVARTGRRSGQLSGIFPVSSGFEKNLQEKLTVAAAGGWRGVEVGRSQGDSEPPVSGENGRGMESGPMGVGIDDSRLQPVAASVGDDQPSGAMHKGDGKQKFSSTTEAPSVGGSMAPEASLIPFNPGIIPQCVVVTEVAPPPISLSILQSPEVNQPSSDNSVTGDPDNSPRDDRLSAETRGADRESVHLPVPSEGRERKSATIHDGEPRSFKAEDLRKKGGEVQGGGRKVNGQKTPPPGEKDNSLFAFTASQGGGHSDPFAKGGGAVGMEAVSSDTPFRNEHGSDVEVAGAAAFPPYGRDAEPEMESRGGVDAGVRLSAEDGESTRPESKGVMAEGVNRSGRAGKDRLAGGWERRMADVPVSREMEQPAPVVKETPATPEMVSPATPSRKESADENGDRVQTGTNAKVDVAPPIFTPTGKSQVMTESAGSPPLSQQEGTRGVQESVISQVMEGLDFRKAKNEGEVIIKLHPAEMGELRINVRMVDQQITVDITAENSGVKNILMGHLDILKEALQRQHLSMERFSVSTGENHGFNQAFREENRPTAGRMYETFSGRSQEADSPDEGIPILWTADEYALVDLRL